MQKTSYVLLYDCWTCDDGHSSVQLKLLCTEHPFASVLLRKGSRIKAAKQDHHLTLWRTYTKTYDKIYHTFVDTWGYRREAVRWESQYGVPSEDHLLLYYCMEAWLNSQAPVRFEMFDSPLLIEGAVKLQSDEYPGPLHSIHSIRNLRQHQYDISSMTSSEMLSQAASDDKTALQQQGSNDYITSTGPKICSEQSSASDNITCQDQQTSAKQCEDSPSTAGTSVSDGNKEVPWQFAHEDLENIVLSCTQSEVHELLGAFMQRKAHEQLSKFKQELLRRFADACNDWELI